MLYVPAEHGIWFAEGGGPQENPAEQVVQLVLPA
jgi:hypothetical protein